MLLELTTQLKEGVDLARAQVSDAVRGLVDEKIALETKADFLAALAQKGESVSEIAAFAFDLREMAVALPLEDEIRSRGMLDVVGTGGDRLGTFNISTTAAILAASAGVTVAKHGNRAATSRTGSADVLEALGIRIDLTPEQAALSLRDHGFAFLFAPKYHPAFRHIAPARKLCAERGQRTIFNYLGPLLNPARPGAQLMGVPSPSLCEPLARVLNSLGVRRGMVVCGSVHVGQTGGAPAATHVDEISTLGPTAVAEFYENGTVCVSTFSPAGFPLQQASLEDLKGGESELNARILRSVLRGEDRGPRRDVALLNAGAALFVAGKARTITDGFDMASDLVDSGTAARKLEELAGFRP